MTPEELGEIIGRLAIADETVWDSILEIAQHAEFDLLPDGLERLQRWARIMRMLRIAIRVQAEQKEFFEISRELRRSSIF